MEFGRRESKITVLQPTVLRRNKRNWNQAKIGNLFMSIPERHIFQSITLKHADFHERIQVPFLFNSLLAESIERMTKEVCVSVDLPSIKVFNIVFNETSKNRFFRF